MRASRVRIGCDGFKPYRQRALHSRGHDGLEELADVRTGMGEAKGSYRAGDAREGEDCLCAAALC
jgi:hypothetical protein